MSQQTTFFFALLDLWDSQASYKSQGSNHSVPFKFCLKCKLVQSREDKFNLVSFFRAVMNTHESDAYTVSPELPAMFDGMKLAAVATVLYVIVRCLNLKSPTAPPDLTYQDTPLSRFLLKSCPQLTKEWVLLSMVFHVGITLKMLVCWRGRCCLSGGGSAPFCYFAQCSTYLNRNYQAFTSGLPWTKTKVCFQSYPHGRLLLPPPSRDWFLFLGEAT